MGAGGDDEAVRGCDGSVVRLVTARAEVEEGVVSILREALESAEDGEVRSVVIFRIMRDGERVVTYSTVSATELVGGLMQCAIQVGRLDP